MRSEKNIQKKYEYLKLSLDLDSYKDRGKLDELGADGWRIVMHYPRYGYSSSSSSINCQIIVFEREHR